ncbi:hypothetical protein BT96DRAFT_946844 [Gymnopus androsaceus JB14]|uniref:Uncharacterized protein n=1 Tax=Gymnopus androsaceus JB14 TaxID=1447944 RepID=A0A6A4GUH2_9AGAR|nr:hypothetical protein BT96DRAFT_946844 [Gymnopus androsaceus JB14]
MHFTLMDRFRSRLQRHRTWKVSSKHQTHVQRSSQDSDDSELTNISAKTSIDTTSSVSTSSSVESLHTPSIIHDHMDLLSTNEQPSPQEALEIHALIQHKGQELLEMERSKEDLDRQRELLGQQIRLLDEKLREMADEIDSYRRVVRCSMRNIPPDVLSEIFQYYVADAGCSSSIGNATVLTHVSRTWRKVALYSSALWTTLSAPYVTNQVVANVLRRLDQVKAATGLPLKLDINLQKSSAHMQDAEFELLSSDLLHASDCADTSLEEVFPVISETITASRLETLDLIFHGSSSSPMQWPLSLVRASPALRDLRFKVPGELQDLSTLKLPHLESLILDLPTISPAALLELLRDAVPGLKSCEVHVAAIVDSDDDALSAMGMVVHSSLETFKLRVSHGGSGDCIAQLFENLTLPSARKVLLEIGHFPSNDSADARVLSDDFDLDLSWPHDSFLGFLERTSSSVTSLCLGFNPTPPESPDLNLMGGMGLTGAELEEDQVRAYLDLENVGKSLVTLHIKRDRPVWPGLLEYLTLLPTKSNFNVGDFRLPKLENIALDVDPIFQVLLMREFVKSRWYDGPSSSSYGFSRLQSFIVTLCFPDIPNVELESAAAEMVFQRIARSDRVEEVGKLNVVFQKRSYAMMPMDVPPLPSRDGLAI